MLPYLNIVITLVFIYLLVAIMITGINEAFFTFARTRATYLKRFIDHLFFDEEWKKIARLIGESPFINVLKKDKGHFPASIPPENFTSALLSIVGNGQTDFETLKANIVQKKDQGELYRLLYAVVSDPDVDLARLRKTVDNVFNSAMDRVAGWFKRFAKIMSLGLAVAISLVLNIDSIQITSSLWKNKEQAEKLATFAVLAQKTLEKTDSGTIRLTDKTTELANITFTPKKPPLNLPSAVVDTSASFTEPAGQVSQTFNLLTEVGIPIGWNKENMPKSNEGFGNCLLAWLLKFLGILLTGFATSLGAPFWFDILSKVGPLKKVAEKS